MTTHNVRVAAAITPSHPRTAIYIRRIAPIAACAWLLSCGTHTTNDLSLSKTPKAYSREQLDLITNNRPDLLRPSFPPQAEMPSPARPVQYSTQPETGAASIALPGGLARFVPVYPTSRYYIDPPDFLWVFKLNNRSSFSGSHYTAQGRYPIYVTWSGATPVEHRLSEGHEGLTVGDFTATSVDDNGVVVGRVVTSNQDTPSTNPNVLCGLIHFAPAWVNGLATAPTVHVAGSSATSSYWNATSRDGSHAVGVALALYPTPTCTDPKWPVCDGGADEYSLTGRYDSPSDGPVLDARSADCRSWYCNGTTCSGCQPSQHFGLRNELLAVNDLGEAVGTAELRGATWYCAFAPGGYSNPYDYPTLTPHPVYVPPGGDTMVDLTPALGARFGHPPTVAGINNNGEIAGSGYDSITHTWRALRYNIHTGLLSLFPNIAGITTTTNGAEINNGGYILVNAWVSAYGSYTLHRYVWTPDDTVYDLGEKGASLASASINDDNEVIASDCTYTSCYLSKWQLPGAKLSITSPADQTRFGLTQSNSTASEPVPFQANPGDGSATVIDWTTTLEYATSKGLGAFHSGPTTFSTIGSATLPRTYSSTGGKLTLSAAAQIEGTRRTAGPNVVYITGTAISPDTITARLVQSYSGATSRLFTGIANKESTYRQFAIRALYGISALWPLESYDGGSHIGLMMMPVSQAHAWDWTVNTQDAAALFAQKLVFARSKEDKIISKHPGLRALTDIERENMALVLYGPAASASLSEQYYVPVHSQSNDWVWSVNYTGNAPGVAYADSVRAMIQ
ncbi:MAG TPA: hypothetical protein VFP50_20275 [Anaeromyxobacteraceae bacterium]|nr:hypothetical protein [Anaeromyxobacteraceae bacterium]